MKIIIVGAGNIGIQIARQLIEENKDVVLIDRDPEKIKFAQNSLDCMVVHGEANARQTLEAAGIGDADFFISVTDSDELNMIACGLVSSEFKVPYKIARVRNIDYSDSRISDKPFLGIDYVINPEIEAARAITRSVEHGATSDIMYFEDSSFQMRTILAAPTSFFAEKTVKDIKESIGLDFIIAVVLRDNDYIIPSGNTVIQRGDTLYIIGEQETLEAIFSWAGKQRVDLKRVILVGGGRMGSYVARNLLNKSPFGGKPSVSKLFRNMFTPRAARRLVIIEKDYETCKELAEKFPESLVINDDISNEGVLEDGDLMKYDLLIAATKNQELNLVTSLYAKTLGIGRAIALVNKNNYLKIASNLEIDTTISLNNTMVNTVLKFVRRGNIKNVHAISGGKLEIIEVSCDEGCTFVGKKIKDLKLPHDTLIIFISNGRDNIIPHGDYAIQYGDHIILITRKESIKKLDKMFDQRI
jgi:trk system potassium uptake protein TrkA